MDILDFLRADGSIVVNKQLAHEIGLNEAVIYSELVSLFKYWKDRNELTDEGMFFCTYENLERNTTIQQKTASRAITRLEKLGLIEKKRQGLPAKTYYRITNGIYDFFKDSKDLNKSGQNVQSDNDSSSGDTNGENSRHTQSGQNVQSREEDLSNLDRSKSLCNNTRTNNTKFNNTNLVNKRVNNSNLESQFVLTEEEENQIYELEKEYRLQGLSQEVIDRVRSEVDEKRNHINNYVAYYHSCLDNTLYKHNMKHGHIELPYSHLPADHPLNYNWINE